MQQLLGFVMQKYNLLEVADRNRKSFFVFTE
jgi:hypothetical protein